MDILEFGSGVGLEGLTYLSKIIVFELQWALLVFCVLTSPEDRFREASERNKDASLTRAHGPQIDPRCPSYHPCGCFPGARFPKPGF